MQPLRHALVLAAVVVVAAVVKYLHSIGRRFIPAQADNRLLDRFVVVAVVVMVVVVDDYCTPICFVSFE
jgi:hypothetical protein